MSSLSTKIGELLGTSIPSGEFRNVIKELDIEGKITQRQIVEIVITLCERVEELENVKSN